MKLTQFLIILMIAIALFLTLEQKYLKFTQKIEFDIQDRLMKHRNKNHIAANDSLALIWIDEPTIRKYDGTSPPRAIEAKMINGLNHIGAKTIAFDFTFEMDRSGTTDLAEASKTINSLVYGVVLKEVDKKPNSLPLPLPKLVPFKIYEVNQSPEKYYIFDRIPCPELRQKTKHLGHIMFQISLDGAVRHIPLIIKTNGRYSPALSLISVCLLRDIPFDGSGITIKWGEYILLDNKMGWKRKIPIDNMGRMRINYIGDIRRFEQSYSFKTLERDMDTDEWRTYWKDLFSDKLVLIGDETQEADLTYTPFSSIFPGVAVHATAIDNILRGEFIHEVPPLLNICLAICFGGILAGMQLWLFPSDPQRKRRSYQFKVITGFIAFLCFTFISISLNFTMFYIKGLLLSFTFPLIGMLPAWIFATSYGYVLQIRREYIYRETIIKNMGNGLLVLDKVGKITTINHEASQLLGLEDQKFLGKHVKDVLKRLPDMADEMTKALYSKEGEKRFPLNVEGRELEVSLAYGEEIPDNPCYIIAVITNVTEVHKLERSLQLQQRRAAYSQLASELNHRIKNRLQTIRLDVDKLMRRIGSDDSIKAILERLTRQIVRMEELATDFKRGISTYENVRNGNWELSDLNQIVKSILDSVSQTMDRDIQVETQLNEHLPLLNLETDWIKDALQNLINNGIDAMPQGGKLTITTEILPDSKVLLTVSDTGEGVSEEDKPKIFTPWFTRKEEGSGMGLYMVQQVIQAHAGEIDFESVMGEGTVFRMIFPVDHL